MKVAINVEVTMALKQNKSWQNNIEYDGDLADRSRVVVEFILSSWYCFIAFIHTVNVSVHLL